MRLLGTAWALEGKVATAMQLFEEAESRAAIVFGMTPLQIQIAWVLSVCRHAMMATREMPSLYSVMLTALAKIEENSPSHEELTNIDMLMHGLDRSRYRVLAVLSCTTTLRIMDDSPMLELDEESRPMTVVNLGNAMLANEAAATEWNAAARQVFQGLIQSIHNDSGKPASPAILYQVAQAYAGIGYSYYNEAKSSQLAQRSDLVLLAKENLASATGLLVRYDWDRWIDARVWACAGNLEAMTGNVQETHRKFAAALVAGAGHYPIRSDDLREFFNPDDDPRLKYSEALVALGMGNAAILFAKAAVHAVHSSAMAADSPDELAIAYIATRTMAHRTLITGLSGIGRHNEGPTIY